MGKLPHLSGYIYTYPYQDIYLHTTRKSDHTRRQPESGIVARDCTQRTPRTLHIHCTHCIRYTSLTPTYTHVTPTRRYHISLFSGPHGLRVLFYYFFFFTQHISRRKYKYCCTYFVVIPIERSVQNMSTFTFSCEL